MTKRLVSLLHVEDSRLIHRLLAGLLAKFEDFAFSITTVESEEAAFRSFQAAPVELVILDYHLKQGNGLSCLRSLRAIDRVVPILAISGTASSEVAAELLEEGADDFINKDDLNLTVLGKSVRTALRRADVWREQREKAANRPMAQFKGICRKLAHLLSDEQANALFHHLAELEDSARSVCGKAEISGEEIARMLRESSAITPESPRGLLLRRLLNTTSRQTV